MNEISSYSYKNIQYTVYFMKFCVIEIYSFLRVYPQ